MYPGVEFRTDTSWSFGSDITCVDMGGWTGRPTEDKQNSRVGSTQAFSSPCSVPGTGCEGDNVPRHKATSTSSESLLLIECLRLRGNHNIMGILERREGWGKSIATSSRLLIWTWSTAPNVVPCYKLCIIVGNPGPGCLPTLSLSSIHLPSSMASFSHACFTL